MNVVFVVIVIAGLVLNDAVAQDTPSGKGKFESFLYERCKVNSPNAADYDRLKGDLDQFTSYLNYTANLLPHGQVQFCKDERPILASSFSTLANDLKPCLPKQEKYLSKFMIESFTELLTFICSNRNIDNFFSTHGRECRANLKQSNEGHQVRGCFSDLFPKRDDYVRKEDMCRNLESAKRCFGMSLARSCPNFAAYTNMNAKFFDAIRKPCNSSLDLKIGSLVLIFLTLISTKVFS